MVKEKLQKIVLSNLSNQKPSGKNKMSSQVPLQ